jgi:hypothetical protein
MLLQYASSDSPIVIFGGDKEKLVKVDVTNLQGNGFVIKDRDN